jgi:hypothetical protein
MSQVLIIHAASGAPAQCTIHMDGVIEKWFSKGNSGFWDPEENEVYMGNQHSQCCLLAFKIKLEFGVQPSALEHLPNRCTGLDSTPNTMEGIKR